MNLFLLQKEGAAWLVNYLRVQLQKQADESYVALVESPGE